MTIVICYGSLHCTPMLQSAQILEFMTVITVEQAVRSPVVASVVEYDQMRTFVRCKEFYRHCTGLGRHDARMGL